MGKIPKLNSAIDPVCGMVISKNDERYYDKKHTLGFEGKEYHFCSKTCKDDFVKNPDEYT